MSGKSKKLSNPFSTGGGGPHFEAHVQASFVALMLTGGHAPCLPCWPIVELKLQGKIDGFDTDDLIVFVENPDTKERRRLLGQVKHSIAITKGSAVFGEVMQAAWNDFSNPEVFEKNKDIIALITGPLSATDAHNVQWLLNQARHTKNADEFFRNVQQANFSSAKSSEKLQVIRHHLRIANGNSEVPKDELYSFLKHFHLLGYDLGNEVGVILSLLHSHISQFQQKFPQWVWSRVVDIVQTWNKDAGTITPDGLPEDLLEAFKKKTVTEMPEEFKSYQEVSKTDWAEHSDASCLALAVLLGAWNEERECDIQVVARLLGMDYDTWLRKAREILHYPDSPLSLKNGVWKVVNRPDLWSLLASRLLDQDLEAFKSLAVEVLKEPDPAFELPAEERYAAGIHGKVSNCSPVIRQGVAEGLAILGSFPDCCSNCSLSRAETTAVLAVREIFDGADWRLWGSLNNLLPTLAEGAPKEFLDAVESALRAEPCPFDELFAQEGDGITGGNYMTGLLWALEGLAWDEQYLVRACSLLADLASHDPGGRWANRPGNSLTDILLPWMPHTLASTEKREVAVRTIVHEWPDVGWRLLLSLLPNQRQMTSGTYKPKWRMTIPDDSEKGATHREYWLQVSNYAELAVNTAGQDVARLSDLIDRFDNLTRPAFDRLIDTLSSEPIQTLPDEQRRVLWRRLSRFIRKHRRHAKAKWSLPDESLNPIDDVSRKLAPSDPTLLYQELFSGRDLELYEKLGDWEEERRKLDERRVSAIKEIIENDGIDGAIRFAESVASPRDAGGALAAVATPDLEEVLLPDFLDSGDRKHLDIATAFVSRRYRDNGWAWCDVIDRTGWRHGQTGQFLASLPFSRETWERAEEWLGNQQGEYWARANASPFETDEGLDFAIDKLLEHGRPYAAIGCLGCMLHQNLAIDAKQCVRALLAALNSSESNHAVDSYNMVELIKHLQSDAAVSDDDLFRVEWAYLPLLDQLSGAQPVLLHKKLANEPEFFCELVQIIYRSSKEESKTVEPPENQKAIAVNAYRLLQEWSRPPGLMDDGTFDVKHFKRWLERVREICSETGHLDVALISVGKVLINAPADKNGLWLDAAAAEALNDRDSEEMRNGFRTALYNTRGVHAVDPSGKPEMDLAETYRRQGEDIENAGFHRLADTLRGLSDAYIREAERVRSDFGGDKDE